MSPPATPDAAKTLVESRCRGSQHKTHSCMQSAERLLGGLSPSPLLREEPNREATLALGHAGDAFEQSRL